MPAPVDITGETFGFLKVIEHSDRFSSGARLWKCECTLCGGITYVKGYDLRRGTTKTCGRLECRAKLKKKNPPRVDCNLYNEKDLCDGLIEMMCVTRGYCKFYKPRED